VLRKNDDVTSRKYTAKSLVPSPTLGCVDGSNRWKVQGSHLIHSIIVIYSFGAFILWIVYGITILASSNQ